MHDRETDTQRPHTAPATDPGLAGAVPFRFACQRSGRCCTQGEGVVWLEPGEPERLAAALGLTVAVFQRSFVRRLVPPHAGRERESLCEAGGRCALLEGQNECRAFPYRPRVLSEPDDFEAARAVCASGYEADWAVERAGTGLSADGACPWSRAGRCEARAGRPIACRLRAIGAGADEIGRRHRQLARSEAELGYPRSYGRLAGLVAARGRPV